MGWGLWGNPFLTSEDVRKYSKSFLAINFNVRKMWGIFFPHVWKRAFGPQKPKRILWVNFSEFGFSVRVFYHVRVWCHVQVTSVELQCHVTETKCVLEVGWEPLRSVISLPSEVVSGSLLRLLKFLPVFKLAVRFAASSALIRSASLNWEWSWSLRAIEHLAMSSWLSGMERNFAEKLD